MTLMTNMRRVERLFSARLAATACTTTLRYFVISQEYGRLGNGLGWEEKKGTYWSWRPNAFLRSLECPAHPGPWRWDRTRSAGLEYHAADAGRRERGRSERRRCVRCCVRQSEHQPCYKSLTTVSPCRLTGFRASRGRICLAGEDRLVARCQMGSVEYERKGGQAHL